LKFLRGTSLITFALTGATGAFGPTVCAAIKEKNANGHLRVLTRYPSSDDSLNTEFVEGDIMNVDLLDKLCSGADLLLHMAGENPSADNNLDFANRKRFIATNILGSLAVARAAKRHSLPLIHVSTVAVYELCSRTQGIFYEDETFDLLEREDVHCFSERVRALRDGPELSSPILLEELVELFPKNVSVYGLTKLLGEPDLLKKSSAIIRPSDIYGPGQRGIINNVVHNIQKSGQATIDLFPRGCFSPIFAQDAAAFITHLVIDYQPGIFNLCGPNTVTAAQLLEMLQQCTNDIQHAIAVEPGPNVAYREYSRQKAEQTQCVSLTDLPTGLRKTFAAIG
jgi:nucleoside-diphosphate-sugar epimerase